MIVIWFWLSAYGAEIGIYCYFRNSIIYSVSAEAAGIFLELSCSNRDMLPLLSLVQRNSRRRIFQQFRPFRQKNVESSSNANANFQLRTYHYSGGGTNAIRAELSHAAEGNNGSILKNVL